IGREYGHEQGHGGEHEGRCEGPGWCLLHCLFCHKMHCLSLVVAPGWNLPHLPDRESYRFWHSGSMPSCPSLEPTERPFAQRQESRSRAQVYMPTGLPPKIRLKFLCALVDVSFASRSDASAREPAARSPHLSVLHGSPRGVPPGRTLWACRSRP